MRRIRITIDNCEDVVNADDANDEDDDDYDAADADSDDDDADDDDEEDVQEHPAHSPLQRLHRGWLRKQPQVNLSPRSLILDP